ncbi:MAG: translation elongation factor Ts, partial [Pseudoflavonifractor sp.]
HVPYIHAGGKIGVLVNMTVSAGLENNEKVLEAGKDAAMQIAALNPRFLDKVEVDQATLDEEKKIMLAQMEEDPKMAAKPEKIKEGIVVGKLGKFFKENCLLQQEFVKDNTMSVEQYIAAVAKEAGGSITVDSFTRFEKGEGIEKKQEDFAAEIAKLAK